MAKYYAVHKGVTPGVYSTWEECRVEVEGYPSAEYKSFKNREDAQSYVRTGVVPKSTGSVKYTRHRGVRKGAKGTVLLPDKHYIAVDGGSIGNSSIGSEAEHQIYDSELDEIVHSSESYVGTNNIAEYIGICEGVLYLVARGEEHRTIYSDSQTAISWYRKGKINSKLTEGVLGVDKTFAYISELQTKISQLKVLPEVKKWETHMWGENPADYGRK